MALVQADWRVLVASELLAVVTVIRRATRWDPDALAAPTLALFDQARILVARADRVAAVDIFNILQPFLEIIRSGTTTGMVSAGPWGANKKGSGRPLLTH